MERKTRTTQKRVGYLFGQKTDTAKRMTCQFHQGCVFWKYNLDMIQVVGIVLSKHTQSNILFVAIPCLFLKKATVESPNNEMQLICCF